MDSDVKILQEAYEQVHQAADEPNPELERLVTAKRSVAYAQLLDLVRKIGEGITNGTNEWPIDQFHATATTMNQVIAMEEHLPLSSKLK